MSEYEDFDFGFTTVDADEVEGGEDKVTETQIANEVASEVSSSVLEKIGELEDKVMDIMESIQVQKEDKTTMEEIEELILPLLYNLLKNPEREYICWPNRTEVIQKQIDKILQLTRK
tara:strand:+ start:57 stop:407 length:351 start_codon:yes stop_codon:yes gene_type:complete